MATAVVLGASLGGLLAARVLTERYDEVLVVERDPLPHGKEQRQGVPQGKHLHGLHPSGLQSLERLFPGLPDEMRAAGAVPLDALRDVDWVVDGRTFVQAPGGETGLFLSRPLLEHLVRERVRALPQVRLLDRTVGLGLCFTYDGTRVSGLRCSGPDGGERTLDADLVVDASGRSAVGHRWLVDAGWPAAEEEVVGIELTYATQLLRAPHARTTFIAPTPGSPRGAGLAPLEDGLWILTVAGLCGERPPADLEGLKQFLRAAPPSRIVERLEDAEPVGPPASFRFPASRRRHYRRLPEQYLPFGDAIASVNPAYGQGMSLAAMQAAALLEVLDRRSPVPAFLRRAEKVVDRAWKTAVYADLGLPGVSGRRTPETRISNRFTSRLCAAATHDTAVTAAFLRVAALLDPPEALLRPRLVAGVLVGSRRAAGRPAVVSVPSQAGPRDADADAEVR